MLADDADLALISLLEDDAFQGMDEITLKDASKTSQVESECAICLEQMMQTRVVELPCHHTHVYHLTCLDVWLTKSNICPVCRTRVAKRAA